MAFGQAPGPPASPRQIARIEELLRRAGFESFREARHPYGLNQRQARGRFTVAEAGLLERLKAAEEVQSPMLGGRGTGPATARTTRTGRARPARQSGLRSLPDDVLADELVRRGWCCIRHRPNPRSVADLPGAASAGSTNQQRHRWTHSQSA